MFRAAKAAGADAARAVAHAVPARCSVPRHREGHQRARRSAPRARRGLSQRHRSRSSCSPGSCGCSRAGRRRRDGGGERGRDHRCGQGQDDGALDSAVQGAEEARDLCNTGDGGGGRSIHREKLPPCPPRQSRALSRPPSFQPQPRAYRRRRQQGGTTGQGERAGQTQARRSLQEGHQGGVPPYQGPLLLRLLRQDGASVGGEQRQVLAHSQGPRRRGHGRHCPRHRRLPRYRLCRQDLGFLRHCERGVPQGGVRRCRHCRVLCGVVPSRRAHPGHGDHRQHVPRLGRQDPAERRLVRRSRGGGHEPVLLGERLLPLDDGQRRVQGVGPAQGREAGRTSRPRQVLHAAQRRGQRGGVRLLWPVPRAGGRQSGPGLPHQDVGRGPQPGVRAHRVGHRCALRGRREVPGVGLQGSHPQVLWLSVQI
mmetsp:Transcript_41617/g.98622  ORF Transcript_41617/g.98622 Transcript_41617/m.98622 type:complete len:424 (-) Transcript_41617:324-1595(-)